MIFPFLILSVAIFGFLPSIAFAENIRDVKGPVDFPFNGWLLFALLVVFFGLGAYLFLRFRRKQSIDKPAMIPSDPRSAWERAMDALRALQKKDFLAEKNFEAYYLELSQVVRVYCEEQFRIKAVEMTTEEFLHLLKTSDELTASHKNILKEFLISCDMVKFARYAPAVEEAQKSFKLAERLIEETKIKEVNSEL